MKHKVLIADADERFRTELVTALKDSQEFEVIGVAADGKEAIQMVQHKRPDILVPDLLLTKYDGLTVNALMTKQHYLEYVKITNNAVEKTGSNHLEVRNFINRMNQYCLYNSDQLCF